MRDPVCGMEVTPDSKGGTTEWQGETYTFCSDKCREKFVAKPEIYVKDPSKDPVCGMAVSEEKNAGSYTHEGREYLFCSSKCQEKFVADPSVYLHPQPKSSDPAEASREYTCPMHPEIVQQGPGSCPKCGMDLEPMAASAEDAEEEEAAIRSLKRKTLVAGLLTLPVLLLAFDSMIPGLSFEGFLSSPPNRALEIFRSL